MPVCEAVKSNMPEYLYIREGYEESTNSFFEKKPEPELVKKYSLGEHDFVNAGNASGDLKLSLKRLGVAPEVLRRVAIAAYEAEINMTAHAKGGDISGNIYAEMIHIEFLDHGPGMKDIEQAMIPGYSTATELVREMGFGAGLGLPNIKKNADVLHIESEEGGQTFVEIIIYFE